MILLKHFCFGTKSDHACKAEESYQRFLAGGLQSTNEAYSVAFIGHPTETAQSEVLEQSLRRNGIQQ